jgi:prepilin-type N-terminal cleavage/methylation domain-containing protein
MTRMRKNRSGFSLIEMLVVICVISICMAIIAPRFRVSAAQHVSLTADQLVNDLEQVRTRAITARGATRLLVTTATNSYTAYLDDDADGVINQVATETAALRGLQTRILTDNVIFGRGAAPQLGGFPGAGATTFPGNAVNFDTRGVTTPFGALGVIYFTSSLDNNAVAAVTVTPGGGIRRWVYRAGVWQ